MKIEQIFSKGRHYSLLEIIAVCDQNGLITVDCLKDEDIISVEKEGADCLFEFQKVGDDNFKLSWAYA